MIHIAKNEVRRFAANAGQLDQIFHRVRHTSAILRQQHLRAVDDVLRLGAEKAARMDVFLNLGHVCLGECLQRRKPRKQRGRNLIYALVSALCRQTHGKQQFIVLFIFQRAFGKRVCLLQTGENLLHLFRCSHCYHPGCQFSIKSAEFQAYRCQME